MNATDKILDLVRIERHRQERKWGPQAHSPHIWHTILSEEVGECAEAILARDKHGLVAELVHVAAVAVAAAEPAVDLPIDTRPLLIYLAGPIADCTDDQAKGWRENLKQIYRHVLDPMARDYRGVEIGPKEVHEIVEGDKHDIDHCDAVVVWYERPTVGTSMEILYAWERNKRIIIIDRGGGSLSPWIRYHSSEVVHTIEGALNALGLLTASIKE